MKQISLKGDAADLEKKAREMADVMRSALPKGWGFTLFIYEEAKDDGSLTYISTSERQSMVEVIRAWLARVSG